jgi:3-hydroxyisobutyrate dehydrogenase-like beta-hydroxyacid dehydrogenase
MAERSGIDPKLAVDVMTESPDRLADAEGPRPTRPRPARRGLGFDVRFTQKDLALALETGRQLHVPLPSAAVADQLLTIARALGYEHRDLASLHEVLARVAGDPA